MAGAAATRVAVETVWRIESPRLVGALVRAFRDVALAEDLAQEALVAALERWPADGIPARPGAWLLAAARNRGLDRLRRRRLRAREHEALAAGDPRAGAPEPDPDEDVGDDVLRLVLVACHPVLSTEARVALTLRLVCGLTTAEIARAFLVPEPTIAQRIVRAKRTLAEARVPFDVPRGAALAPRLASVLEVVYLVFNEGYAATSGDDWMRPALCEDALRLGRMLAALAPGEAEVHGLVALMELHASRAGARVGPGGEPVLLADQDRARWDPLLLHRGLAALARAEALIRPLGPYALQAAIAACHAQAATAAETDWPRIVALYDALAELSGSPVEEAEVHGLVALMELHASRAGARVGPGGAPVLLADQDRSRWDRLLVRRGLAALARAEALARPLGPYALQAAIAACHARAATAAETDWARVVALYDALAEVTGSPVVALNRAVAVAMAFGPAAGLALVDELADDPALRSYHLLPSVRGELLARLGRAGEARAEYERAALLAGNARERELLLARARACA